MPKKAKKTKNLEKIAVQSDNDDDDDDFKKQRKKKGHKIAISDSSDDDDLASALRKSTSRSKGKIHIYFRSKSNQNPKLFIAFHVFH